MKYLLQKDKLKRQLFKKKELDWLLARSLIHNQYISFFFRKFLYENFLIFNLNSSKHRIKNRCYITGRTGSVLKKFKVSRHTFRELSLSGKIQGVRKASW